MEVNQKKKILFVDDEESILEIASEYFKHKGYQVITAKNGLEALNILGKEKIDCCFTDINMPEMDGLELAEHVRMSDNTIPVIVMTGFPSLENTIQTLKNGVVDFLIKPVNLNQMELCVRRVFRERQLFVENILLKKEMEGQERLKKLNRELLYKVRDLNILNRIMSDFTTISSSSDVFQRVVDMTLEITPADRSYFYVINEAFAGPAQVAASVSPQAHMGKTGFGETPAKILLEIVADELPLLVAENNQKCGLPPEISSFMAVPLKIREKVFGVLTASLAKSPAKFSGKDLYYLSFMTQKAAYAIENLALYENIYENLFSTLFAFVRAIEARDPYTEQHSNRVTRIAIEIAKAMGCTREELDILTFAGRLHDIGKIGIRDDILLKPGKLTEEEFKLIKEHPDIGASIVGQLGLLDREKQIIRCHHERVDGTGYPDGLRKDDIPALARILSVADAYDAMASDRAYRRRMDENIILKILREGAGSQFDPDAINAFFSIYEQVVLNPDIQDVVG